MLKQLYFLVFIGFLTFSSCQSKPGKDSSVGRLTEYYRPKIVGLWKLIETKYPSGSVLLPGQNEYLRFTNDSVFSNYYAYKTWNILFQKNDSLNTTDAIIVNKKGNNQITEFSLFKLEFGENKGNESLYLTDMQDHSVQRYIREDLIK